MGASEFIYCDLCNGCFVDQTAYFLNISSPVALVLYIAIASVILGFLGGIILYCVLRKNMTKKASNPEEWKQKILDFYKENNPEKLEDTGTLEMLFAKYKGQERPLYNMIRKKYDARQNTATETELASPMSKPSRVPTDLEYKQPKHTTAGEQLTESICSSLHMYRVHLLISGSKCLRI